ncbi:hypothetical protein CHLNCDRAFT_58396 [Chlorella variabilis]|uniref:Rad50/SbcC-type AAA domain-containing protein n=1 Tax=Chlorella variabilis TaxID=554065 RepID=E1ZJX0_CHLVA|nr:hypothetical protein CHLNCDRAFT_58396 [Chlorella variabilis]EFN53934.1 hypothetical protein CHLNCDRAFT_58396 [Chlorella variabilis]|eukprot:XP_005846036.1 hypothetical protein CHLNCDRAFT_58396 [Chlorella variabilis]
MIWDEVFNSKSSVVLDLGPGGRAAFPDFQPPARRPKRRPTVISPLKLQAAASAAASGAAAGPAAAAPEPAEPPAKKPRGSSKGAGKAAGKGGSRKRASAASDEQEPPRRRGWPPKNAAAPPQRDQQGAAPPPSQQQQQSWRLSPSQAQPSSQQLRRRHATQQKQEGSNRAGPSQPAVLPGGGDSDDDAFREPGPSQRGPSQRGPSQRGPSQQGRGRPAQRKENDCSDVPDPEGAPAAGVVKRVELQHFMCHTHLAIDLCPNVNLLTGANGSGKSAVLQALQCCLGARASDTGRYRAMKKFVQRGQAQAVIKVTLWNTGPEAYRRSLLGPEVTVVRKINDTTGGGYEILDCKGRLALKGVRQAKELIEDLSIDASNPAIVLTQDMARSFAGEKTEGDKFRGFMQATHFETTREHLQSACERVGCMQEKLEAIAASIEALQQTVADKESLLEQLRGTLQYGTAPYGAVGYAYGVFCGWLLSVGRGVDGRLRGLLPGAAGAEVKAWQDHYDKLVKCLQWAPVESLEKGIAMLREALHDTFPAKQQAHAAQAASYQQQLATIEASLDEQQRLLQEASAAAEGHDRQVHRLREEAKGKREEVRGWQRQLGEHQARVQELEEERAALEEANQEVAEDFMRSTQEAVAGHRQRVAACRDRCERAGVAASGARQYRAEREAALAAAREGVLAAERSLVDGQNRLRRVEGDLQRLQASQETPLAKFGGQGTVELAAAVEAAVRAGRFRHRPILLGSQLSLADERWGVAVEAAMGRTLSWWIVDNHADAALLKASAAACMHALALAGPCMLDLRGGLRLAPQGFSVIVASYAHPRHTIPPHMVPPEGVPTCLRLLRIQEGPAAHVVHNVLVDHASVERTLLTHTHREAKERARDRDFWQQYRIANAFAKDGSKAYRRGASEFSLPPDSSRPLRPRLVRDLSQQLAECRGELEEAQASLCSRHRGWTAVAALQATVFEQRQQAAEAQQDLQRAEQAFQASLREKQTLDTQYQEALSHQPLDVDVGAGDGEAAQRLAQLGNQIAEAEVQADVAEDALKAAQAELERLARKLLEARAVPQQVAEQLATCRDAITTLAAEKEGVAQALAEAREASAGVLQKMAVVAAKLAEAEGHFEQSLRDAEGVCSREEAAAMRAQLVAEWHKEGQSEEAIRGLLEQPAMERRVAQVEHKIVKREADAQSSYDQLEVELADLRNKLAKRRLRHAEGEEALRECESGCHIRRRKFKEIRYNVSTNLSKSFQRYLGYRQHCGSIDVDYKRERLVFKFMDAINRRLALEFLLQFAWRNPERQVLLLTPQDVSVLEEAKGHVEKQLNRSLPPNFIKIQRMRAPRDRQQQQEQAA